MRLPLSSKSIRLRLSSYLRLEVGQLNSLGPPKAFEIGTAHEDLAPLPRSEILPSTGTVIMRMEKVLRHLKFKSGQRLGGVESAS